MVMATETKTSQQDVQTSKTLKKITYSKRQVIKSLRIIAMFNMLLLLLNLTFFLVAITHVFIGDGGKGDKRFSSLVYGITNILNATSLVLYWIGTMFWNMKYINLYMFLNGSWLLLFIIVTFVLIFTGQITDTNDYGFNNYALIFLAFMYAAVNGIVMGIVDFYMRRLTRLNRVFGKTLTKSRSRSASQQVSTASQSVNTFVQPTIMQSVSIQQAIAHDSAHH